jgi:hypothetical protein
MTVTFEPTHAAPRDGLATWPEPDGTTPTGPALPGLLPVVLREQRGGWALVECSNGWTAWVDAGRLVAIGDTEGAPEVRSPVRLGRLVVSVPLLGGIAIVVAAFLPWFESPALGFQARSAHRFPLAFLSDHKVFLADQGFVSRPGGTSIGTALVVLGLATVVLSQTKLPSILTRIAGVVVLVMATLFLTQVQRGMGQLVVARSFSVLGMGVYVAAVSGLVVGLARGPLHDRQEQQ